MRPFWKPLDVPEVITKDEDHSISIKYFILQPMFFIRIFSNRGWKTDPKYSGCRVTWQVYWDWWIIDITWANTCSLISNKQNKTKQTKQNPKWGVWNSSNVVFCKQVLRLILMVIFCKITIALLRWWFTRSLAHLTNRRRTIKIITHFRNTSKLMGKEEGFFLAKYMEVRFF